MKKPHHVLIWLGLTAALFLSWCFPGPSLAGRRGVDPDLSPITVSPASEPASGYMSPRNPEEVTPPAGSAGRGNAGWNNNTGWSNNAGWSNTGWSNTGWNNKGWNNPTSGNVGPVKPGSGNISPGNLPKKIGFGSGNPPTSGVSQVNSGYGAAGYGNLGMGTASAGKSGTPGGGNPSFGSPGSATTGYGSSSYDTYLRTLGSGR